MAIFSSTLRVHGCRRRNGRRRYQCSRSIDRDDYPTADYGTEDGRFLPGEQHMDGERALKYVRTRHRTVMTVAASAKSRCSARSSCGRRPWLDYERIQDRLRPRRRRADQLQPRAATDVGQTRLRHAGSADIYTASLTRPLINGSIPRQRRLGVHGGRRPDPSLGSSQSGHDPQPVQQATPGAATSTESRVPARESYPATPTAADTP